MRAVHVIPRIDGLFIGACCTHIGIAIDIAIDIAIVAVGRHRHRRHCRRRRHRRRRRRRHARGRARLSHACRAAGAWACKRGGAQERRETRLGARMLDAVVCVVHVYSIY